MLFPYAPLSPSRKVMTAALSAESDFFVVRPEWIGTDKPLEPPRQVVQAFPQIVSRNMAERVFAERCAFFCDIGTI